MKLKIFVVCYGHLFQYIAPESQVQLPGASNENAAANGPTC